MEILHFWYDCMKEKEGQWMFIGGVVFMICILIIIAL
jgi:hypothetical protein